MPANGIWEQEESLWIGGRLAYMNHMAPGCLMAFPESGLVQNDAILEAVDSAPRWRSVSGSRRAARAEREPDRATQRFQPRY